MDTIYITFKQMWTSHENDLKSTNVQYMIILHVFLSQAIFILYDFPFPFAFQEAKQSLAIEDGEQ